jgi:hypothetical protein
MEQKFEAWCIVELFGHAKISGHCTEQNIAGTNMLRVDVPETVANPAFSRLFGSSAIYAINPVDEQTARFMAEKLQVKPLESWNLSEVMKKYNERLLIKQVTDDDDPDPDEDDDDGIIYAQRHPH